MLPGSVQFSAGVRPLHPGHGDRLHRQGGADDPEAKQDGRGGDGGEVLGRQHHKDQVRGRLNAQSFFLN